MQGQIQTLLQGPGLRLKKDIIWKIILAELKTDVNS